jgi:CMP-N-acetylneuraminic acid synthetase
VKLFIPIKGESVRVPRKNFRQFGYEPLYKFVISKFNAKAKKHKFRIYVDTDSDEIVEGLQDYEFVTAYKRDPKLIGNEVSVNLLIRHFIDMCCTENDIVCQTHVTSPFLNVETVLDARRTLKLGFDSICSATRHQSRFWVWQGDDSTSPYMPLNHNPLELIPTQSLRPVYEENSAFYMFNAGAFILGNNRITANHLFNTISYPESIDIDTEADLEEALRHLLHIGDGI